MKSCSDLELLDLGAEGSGILPPMGRPAPWRKCAKEASKRTALLSNITLPNVCLPMGGRVYLNWAKVRKEGLSLTGSISLPPVPNMMILPQGTTRLHFHSQSHAGVQKTPAHFLSASTDTNPRTPGLVRATEA